MNILKALERKLVFWKEQICRSDDETDSLGNNNMSDIFSKEQIIEHIERIEQERQTIIAHKLKGAMTRSRQNWLQHGEKANYNKKNRFQIKINEVITTDIKQIIEHQDQFYEKLYNKRNIVLPNNFFQDISLPKLTEAQKLSLDEDIKDDEIKKALFSLKKRQSHRDRRTPSQSSTTDFGQKYMEW